MNNDNEMYTPIKRLSVYDLTPKNQMTGRKWSFYCSPRDLAAKLGDTSIVTDSYKVSREWVFLDARKNIYAVYDWKATSTYDSGLPSPDEFWGSDSPYEFYISTNFNLMDSAESVERAKAFSAYIATLNPAKEEGGG